MTVPLTMWDTVSRFSQTAVSSKLAVYGNVAVILAATLCAVGVLKTAYDYMQGTSQSSYWQVLRPFVILVLVCQFNTLVLKPFTATVNVFAREMASGTDEVNADYWQQLTDNSVEISSSKGKTIEQTYEEQMRELEKDGSFFGRMLFTAKTWIQKVLMQLLNVSSLGIGTAVAAVLLLIAKILLFVQQMLAAVYLAILSIAGPFIFAISILPGFEGGIRNWISRYIQIALWVPVGYLIMGLNLELSGAVAKSASAAGGSLSGQWIMTAFEVVTIVSVASVPKICQWFIESTGANDAHGSISQPARMLARKITKS